MPTSVDEPTVGVGRPDGDADVFYAFYQCLETGDRVDSENPERLDRDTMINVALQVTRMAGDFFGIIDDLGTTLQFLVLADGGVRMEVPVPERRGSWFRHITFLEFEEVLLSVRLPLGHQALGPTMFQAW